MTSTPMTQGHPMELHDHLTAEPEGWAPDRWVCDTDERATWALRRLHKIRLEQARIRQAADAERARIDVWQADALKPLEHDEQFFVGQLQGFYHQVTDGRGPKDPKSYKLPSGTLKMRAGRERTEVVEDLSFTAWALDEYPEALSYKPKVSALKDLPREVVNGETRVVTEDGEIVPGVVVERGPDVFDAKTADITDEPF